MSSAYAHMASKNIALREDVYLKPASGTRGDESLSGATERPTEGTSAVMAFA